MKRLGSGGSAIAIAAGVMLVAAVPAAATNNVPCNNSGFTSLLWNGGAYCYANAGDLSIGVSKVTTIHSSNNTGWVLGSVGDANYVYNFPTKWTIYSVTPGPAYMKEIHIY